MCRQMVLDHDINIVFTELLVLEACFSDLPFAERNHSRSLLKKPRTTEKVGLNADLTNLTCVIH